MSKDKARDAKHALKFLHEELTIHHTIYVVRVDFYRKAQKHFYRFFIADDTGLTEITFHIARVLDLKRDTEPTNASGGIATSDPDTLVQFNLSQAVHGVDRFLTVGMFN